GWLQCGRGLLTAERELEKRAKIYKTLLQCGRGLLTAESDAEKRLAAATGMLQCGRGLLTAESVRAAGRFRQSLRASMWPRSFDRGKPRHCNYHRTGRVASMWPRSFDRGKAIEGMALTNA